jgi:hypothetical protein
MKYLCLCYHDEQVIDGLSQADWAEMMDETMSYLDTLKESGQLVDARPLQSVRNATSVRVRNDRITTTDGPFAETKEQLGGYFMVEARDLNEAIQIAAKWPGARNGTVEVRPVDEGLKMEGRFK